MAESKRVPRHVTHDEEEGASKVWLWSILGIMVLLVIGMWFLATFLSGS